MKTSVTNKGMLAISLAVLSISYAGAQTIFTGESEVFGLNLSPLNEAPAFAVDPDQVTWNLRSQREPIQIEINPALPRPAELYQSVSYTVAEGIPDWMEVTIENDLSGLSVDLSQAAPGDSFELTIIADDGQPMNNTFQQTVSLHAELPEPGPGNPDYPDMFANAREISMEGRDSGVLFEDTSFASREPGEDRHNGFSVGKSIWLTIYANRDGQLIFDTNGSDYSTAIEAYRMPEGESDIQRLLKPANLEQFNQPDPDNGAINWGGVAFEIESGQQYWIAIEEALPGIVGLTKINWSYNNLPGIIIDNFDDVRSLYHENIEFSWTVDDIDSSLGDEVGLPLVVSLLVNDEPVLFAYPSQSSGADIDKIEQKKSDLQISQNWEEENDLNSGWIYLKANNLEVSFVESNGFDVILPTPLSPELVEYKFIAFDQIRGKQEIPITVDWIVPAPINDALASAFTFDNSQSTDLASYPLLQEDLLELENPAPGFSNLLRNHSASHDAGESLPEIENSEQLTGSVWIKWKAPATGQAIIEVIGESAEAIATIYHSSSSDDRSKFNIEDYDQITEVDDFFDGSENSLPVVDFEVEANTVYYIALDTFTSESILDFSIHFQIPPEINWLPPNLNEFDIAQGEASVVLGGRAIAVQGIESVELYALESNGELGEILTAGVIDGGSFEFGLSDLDAGIYDVVAIVTDMQGLQARTSSLRLIIRGEFMPPTIGGIPQSVRLAEGQNYVLDPIVEGTPEFTYLWEKDEEYYSEFKQLEILSMRDEDEGSYQLTVFNNDGPGRDGKAISQVINISMIAPPVITEDLDDELIASSGDDVELSIEAEGDDLHYTWYRNRVELENAPDADTLEILDFQSRDIGRYYVEVWNGNKNEGSYRFVDSRSVFVDLTEQDKERLAQTLLYPDQPRSDFWIPDGPVSHIVNAFGRAYIAGDFNTVGPHTGSLVRLNTGQSESVVSSRQLPLVGMGGVYAIESDGQFNDDGESGYFVGGNFRSIGGEERQGLARILSNGSVDENFAPKVSGTVFSIELINQRILLVGGNFNAVDGHIQKRNIFAYDIKENVHLSALEGEFGGSRSGQVNVIREYNLGGSQFIVFGGNFEQINFNGRPFFGNVVNLLVENKNEGQVFFNFSSAKSWATRVGAGAHVRDIRLFQGETANIQENPPVILVAGNFEKGLKVLAAPNGIPFDDEIYFGDQFSGVERVGGGPIITEKLRAIHIKGNSVFLGGNFPNFNGNFNEIKLTRMEWNPASGRFEHRPMNSKRFMGGEYEIHSLESDDEYLYIGGAMVSANASSDTARNLLRLSLDTNQYDENWAPNPNKEVLAMHYENGNGDFIVGGQMIMMGGLRRHGIACLDLINGKGIEEWDLRLEDGEIVTAMESGPSSIFVSTLNQKNVNENFKTRLLKVGPVLVEDPEPELSLEDDPEQEQGPKSDFVLDGKDYWNLNVQTMRMDPTQRVLVCAGYKRDSATSSTPWVVGVDINSGNELWIATTDGSKEVDWGNNVRFRDIAFRGDGNLMSIVGEFGIGETQFSFAEFNMNSVDTLNPVLIGQRYNFSSVESDSFPKLYQIESFWDPNKNSYQWVVVGDFKLSSGPITTTGFAVIDGSDDSFGINEDFLNSTTSDRRFFSLWMDQSRMIIGGAPDTTGRFNVRMMNLENTEISDFSWNPALSINVSHSNFENAIINSINGDSGPLLIGGDFNTVGGSPHPFLAVFYRAGAPILRTLQLPGIQDAVSDSEFRFIFNTTGEQEDLNVALWRNGINEDALIDQNLGDDQTTIHFDVEDDEGFYRVKIENPKGRVWSPGFLVRGVSKPSLLADLKEVYDEFVPGDDMILEVQLSDDQNLDDFSFQWYRNDRTLAGESSPQLTVSNVSLNDSGKYRVDIQSKKNPSIRISSNEAEVNIIGDTVPNLMKGSLDSVEHFVGSDLLGVGKFTGERDTSNVSVRGINIKQSQWIKWTPDKFGYAEVRLNGAPGLALAVFEDSDNLSSLSTSDLSSSFKTSNSGQNDLGLYVVGFPVENNKSYYVGILSQRADYEGEITLEAEIFRGEEKPIITSQPQSGTYERGNRVDLIVSWQLGTTAPDIKWFKGRTLIPGENKDTYTIESLDDINAGWYRALLTNPDTERSTHSAQAEIEIGDGNQSRRGTSQDDLGNLVETQEINGLRSRVLVGDYPVLFRGTTGSQVLNNSLSTQESFELDLPGVSKFSETGASRWFQVETKDSGFLRLDTLGSAIRTSMSVWQGDQVENLEFIAESTLGGIDGRSSEVVVLAQQDENFLIKVDGLLGDEGIIQINWSLGFTPDFGPSTPSGEITVYQGESFEIQSGLISGTYPEPELTWYKNELPLIFENGPVFQMDRARLSDSGEYYAVASNDYGSVSSKKVKVIVTERVIQPEPDLELFIATSNNGTGNLLLNISQGQGVENAILQGSYDLNTWQDVNSNIEFDEAGNAQIEIQPNDALRYFRTLIPQD